MTIRNRTLTAGAKLVIAVSCLATLSAQEQTRPDSPERQRPRFEGPPGSGPGGPGGGGPNQQERKLRKQFDLDGDKRLNNAERQAAREFLQKEQSEGRGPRRFGPRGGNENMEPPQPGKKLTPADVKNGGDAPLYEPKVVRTVFLQFENKDWEKEMAAFNNTDVEVPATVTIDGKTFKDVGVHFRGASSYFTVQEGRKRSLNLSLDDVHEEQSFQGYRTLNLLNSHTDPSYLRTILYYQAARDYIPAPKANYMRVVINGENWGIYVNSEQFNKDFVKEWFNTTKGARWKVPGSPRGRGGLEYLGDNAEDYKRIYEIKTKDDPKAWSDFIRLTRILNNTPPEKLEKELEPILDIEGTLKFLALENALVNDDGYWTRASDYNIYQDEKGRFHIIPHDANETFRAGGGGPGGPGGFRGPRPEGAGGAEGPRPGGAGPGPQGGPGVGPPGARASATLDPLAGTDAPDKPLLSKLLKAPGLQDRYLAYIKAIAETWLDWKKIEPIAKEYQGLIAEDIKTETRNLYPYEAFAASLSTDTEEQGPRGPRRSMSLKSFVEQRRKFLLEHEKVKAAPPLKSSAASKK
jgi:hypothetical protein